MDITTITLNKDNIDDFAKERNRMLSLSNAEWILFLDSDEVLSDELKEEIKNLNPDEQTNGYYILREGIAEEKLLRLARKDAGKWERCVHEVWRVKGKIGCLKNPMIHDEEKSLTAMIKKANFYSTLHASANKREGKKSNILKIIVFPVGKFFQTLFVKRAYKKGVNGFVFSFFQSFQSFLSWCKLYFLRS